MTFEKYRDPRTLADVLRTLEDITSDCLAKERAVRGYEAERLRDVVLAAEVAREKVLDLSIKMAEYITYCLQHDDINELPPE